MKRIIFLSAAVLISGIALAGGIVTNTNQSAMFTRLQARDATLGIDAVYFNPAGLSFLPNNGLYISLNNQTLGQTRTVSSDYANLNQSEFIGNVSAPFFPGLYVAYKMNKISLSAGFNPIGGGGGGTYDDGLPSFEYSVADLVPALASQGATAYRSDVYFEGSSTYFGYQANISYKINDMFSVALGGRLVTARDAYNGYLRDVELNMGGTWMAASDVFTGIADQFRPGLTGTTAIVDGGGGGLTFTQAEAGMVIDAATRAQLEGGLLALGVPQSTIDGLTITQAQAYYQGAVNQYDATAVILQDQEADMEKTAMGFTPIISVNIHPSDALNIAIKYEHSTTLEFENNTTSDFITGLNDDGTQITMFPDGEKSRYDIPAQLTLGATYRPIDQLMLSGSVHYYFDEQADWAGREETLDGNAIELGIGVEYALSDKLALSAGYLFTKSGATEAYQTDLSYSLPSSSIGGGFAYAITPKLEINLGGSYTIYQNGEKNFDHDVAGSGLLVPVMETYDKDVWIVAIGVNINLNAGK